MVKKRRPRTGQLSRSRSERLDLVSNSQRHFGLSSSLRKQGPIRRVRPSGLAVTPKGVVTPPLVARVGLDDAGVANALPAGSSGDAAIYTDHVKLAHIIRKVVLRQIAITNYVNPF